MDDLMKMIFRPGTLVLAIAIYASTHIFRRIVETARPGLKRQATEMDKAAMYGSKMAMWWNEVVLYAMPVIAGAGFAFWPSEFLFGAELATKDRAMLACGVGWFSGTVYKAIRKALMAKAGLPDTGDSMVPVRPSDRP